MSADPTTPQPPVAPQQPNEPNAGDSHRRAAPGRSRIPKWIRVGAPFAVVLGGATILAVLWQIHAGDSTRQVISAFITVPSTLFAILLWWLFLSGVAWSTRLLGVGAVAVVVGIFFAFVRVKEFSGAMIPRFESRWRPTTEERAAAFFKSANAAARPSEGSAAAELLIGPTDWFQFEGPNRDGVAERIHLRTDWDRHPPKLLWRHPVGAGWSSFAVVDRLAFTQEQRGPDETVVCYDAQSGKQVWEHRDPGVRHSTVMGGLGPRATPTLADSRLYAFGATGILNCLEPRTGAVVWSVNAVKDAGVPPMQFGMSGSPLVYDNLVVVNAGGVRSTLSDTRQSGRAVIAYDRRTGKPVWTAGDYEAGYASPVLATIDGVRQVVIYDTVGAGGYDAATGKELWRSQQWKNSTDNNIAQPIVRGDGSIFLSSGYGTGSILFDVKRNGSEWSAVTRWTAPNKFKLKFNTGVYRGGFAYGLDEGILACIDLSTGQIRWKKGRYGYGQVLLLENALLVLSEEGDVALLDVSPSGSRELARFHAIDGKTWNHPALSNGRLFVRNGEEAACYDFGPPQTGSANP